MKLNGAKASSNDGGSCFKTVPPINSFSIFSFYYYYYYYYYFGLNTNSFDMPILSGILIVLAGNPGISHGWWNTNSFDMPTLSRILVICAGISHGSLKEFSKFCQQKRRMS
ncbi:hypothetical protein L1049_022794 [Liquidambar formosana]|uniref:Uncharacterized protein n=1 Tax=Liquidambar formosana TaxID=63359 RepID=A0AAP0WP68_LIQFO